MANRTFVGDSAVCLLRTTRFKGDKLLRNLLDCCYIFDFINSLA
jgi:hypothetical protein